MTTTADAADGAHTPDELVKQPVQYRMELEGSLVFSSQLQATSQHDSTWIKWVWLALMTALVVVVPIGAWLLSLIPVPGAWLIVIGIAFGALDAWVGYMAIGKLRTQKQYPPV
jgi:predicted exporter